VLGSFCMKFICSLLSFSASFVNFFLAGDRWQNFFVLKTQA
jgi:hypothetical protein